MLNLTLSQIETEQLPLEYDYLISVFKFKACVCYASISKGICIKLRNLGSKHAAIIE